MSDDRMDEIIRDAARDYNRPGTVPREEMWERLQRARQAPRAAVAPRAPRRDWIWRGAGIAAVLVIGIGIGRLVEQKRIGANAATRRVSSNDSLTLPAAVVSASADSGMQAGAGASRSSDRDALPTSTPPAAPSTVRLREYAHAPALPAGSEQRVGAPRDDAPAEGLAFRLAVLQHLAGTEAMLVSFRTATRSGDVDAQLTTWARNLLRTTRLLRSSQVATNDETLKRLLDDLELVLLQIAQYTSTGPRRAEELELIEQSIDKRGVMTKLRATNPAPRWTAGT
jgi:hypothetical protein